MTTDTLSKCSEKRKKGNRDKRVLPGDRCKIKGGDTRSFLYLNGLW